MTVGLRRRLALLLGVLCILAAACGGGSDDGSEEAEDAGGSGGAEEAQDFDPDGVVKIAYDFVAPAKGGFSWDPTKSTTNVGDVAMFHLVYGGLMRPDPEGKLVPELASDATLVDDNTIEVELREGVTYADGSELTADLVKGQLERNLSNPNLPAFQPAFFSLKTVEATGERTLRLGIPDGTAAGWYDNFMGGVETVIVPPGTDFSKPSGAGPYRVTAFTPEVSATLEKNPDYWDADSIKVATIEAIHALPSGNARIAALQSGQVDFALIERTQVDAIKGNDEFGTIVAATPGQLAGFQLCETEPPFDDPEVRVALGRAIDRDAINEALYDGAAVPAYSVWPEGHRFYLEGLEEDYGYDPEAAKDLLAEAGHPDGFEFDLLSMSLLGMPEIAQVVQQQWEAIGVKVNITVTEDIVQDLYIDKKAPVGLIPVLGLTPRLNRWTALTTNNVCKLQDPKLNDLNAKVSKVSTESDEAVELWHQIQEYMAEMGYGVHVIYGTQVHGYNKAKLVDVAATPHPIPLPDMWQLAVKA